MIITLLKENDDSNIQKTRWFIHVQTGALRPVSKMITCVFLTCAYNGGAIMVEEACDGWMECRESPLEWVSWLSLYRVWGYVSYK